MSVYHVNHSRHWRDTSHRYQDLRSSSKEHLELLNLMRRLMRKQVTVPHDKIYAVLGLAADVDVQTSQVDYSIPFCEVFANVTRVCISQHSDLTVLRLVNITPTSTMKQLGCRQLPSWIPDYRFEPPHLNNLRLHNGGAVLLHGKRRQYFATGETKYSSLNETGSLLTCHGVRLGCIQKLSERPSNLRGAIGINPKVLNGGEWLEMVKAWFPDRT